MEQKENLQTKIELNQVEAHLDQQVEQILLKAQALISPICIAHGQSIHIKDYKESNKNLLDSSRQAESTQANSLNKLIVNSLIPMETDIAYNLNQDHSMNFEHTFDCNANSKLKEHEINTALEQLNDLLEIQMGAQQSVKQEAKSNQADNRPLNSIEQVNTHPEQVSVDQTKLEFIDQSSLNLELEQILQERDKLL